MEINNTDLTVEARVEELLPWHKPAIQRLVVNLDTNDSAASGVDAIFHELFGP